MPRADADCPRDDAPEPDGPALTRRVLNVGNCSYDHGMIEELILANFDAEVVPASSPDEALRMLREGRFDAESLPSTVIELSDTSRLELFIDGG